MRKQFTVRLALVWFLCGCRVERPSEHPARVDPLGAARERIAAGEHAAAVGLLELVVGADANDVEAWKWLAHCRVVLSEPERALEDFERCLELAPDDPWVHYARGAVLETMGRHEEALVELTRAIELEPAMFKAWQHRAATHALLERHELAVRDYTRALELTPSTDPELASLHLWRARSLHRLGRHGEASEDERRAEQLVRTPESE